MSDEVQGTLMAAATNTALPSIATTFGAIYICTAVGLMLSGLVLHQTYRYVHLYPEDALYLKLMVGGLLVLDTLHSATALHVCYYYLVQNYFFPESLAKGIWSIQSLTMETGVIVIVSHCFFTRRLFFMAGRKIVYLIGIGTLLLAELSMCTVATVEIVKKGTFVAFQDSMWTLWAAFSIAVTVDVICSIGLTYHLQRNRTGFKKTDSMVDVLMVYTINTGLITSLCTLGALAVVLPKALIFTGVYVVASKLYSNSLLAVLNSRRSILEYGMACWDTASLGLQITSPRPDHSIRFARFSEPQTTTFTSKGPSDTTARGSENIFVKITTETVVKTSSQDMGERRCDRTSEGASTLGRVDAV